MPDFAAPWFPFSTLFLHFLYSNHYSGVLVDSQNQNIIHLANRKKLGENFGENCHEKMRVFGLCAYGPCCLNDYSLDYPHMLWCSINLLVSVFLDQHNNYSLKLIMAVLSSITFCVNFSCCLHYDYDYHPQTVLCAFVNIAATRYHWLCCLSSAYA